MSEQSRPTQSKTQFSFTLTDHGKGQVKKSHLDSRHDAIYQNADRVLRLKLSDMGLEHFPSELLYFEKLKALDLSGNHIASIPDAIEQFTSLETLDLSDNPVKTLPVTLCELPAIKTIVLANSITVDFTSAGAPLKDNGEKLRRLEAVIDAYDLDIDITGIPAFETLSRLKPPAQSWSNYTII